MSTGQVIITIVTLLISSGLIRSAFTALAQAIDAHTAQKDATTKLDVATSIAWQAARAVEQMARANAWRGEQKLREALPLAQSLAVEHGIVLSDTEWETLLESAVLALNQAREGLDATKQAAASPTATADHLVTVRSIGGTLT